MEITEISSDLDAFLTSWTAHGNDLNAGYEIKYKRFIIIALDQSTQGATGCSIDASVRFIQELERKYNVMLLDKMNVSYKQGEFVAYKSLLDFKAMIFSMHRVREGGVSSASCWTKRAMVSARSPTI